MSEAKYCLFKFASFFSKEVADLIPMWGLEMHVDNTRSKQVLQLSYRPPKESINEMVYSMIETGIIEDKRPKT